MPRCGSFREDLTAWIDGQLPRERAAEVGQHATQCPTCGAEVSSLRAAIDWQRQALRVVTTVDGIDTAALQSRLRRGVAAHVDDSTLALRLRGVWSSMWGRAALAGVAASVAAIVILVGRDPGMVLIPLGLESPPPAIATQTELFREYPLIEQLDVLENFDTVESVPLDDEGAPQQG